MTASGDTEEQLEESTRVLAEISPWHILRFLIQNRFVILGTVVVVTVLVVAAVFASPRSYTSRFSFSPPTSSGTTSQIASLAAQFGMSLGSSGGERSPAYYASLVTSRVVQDRISAREYVGRDSVRGTIADIVELEGSTPAIRKDQMASWLTENVKAEVNTETGVIRVTAEAPTAAFAFALASAAREEIHRFNQESRRAQATSERTFIETRVAESRESLTEAENRLRSFLERNRQFRESPELSFEHDRLQREVLLRQQLFASLNQALQQAQIAEVRDTPLLTVIDEPLFPALPASRRLIVVVFLCGVLGTLLGLAIAVIRQPPESTDVARHTAYLDVIGYLRSWIPPRLRRSA